jgi:hypothetical protein
MSFSSYSYYCYTILILILILIPIPYFLFFRYFVKIYVFSPNCFWIIRRCTGTLTRSCSTCCALKMTEGTILWDSSVRKSKYVCVGGGGRGICVRVHVCVCVCSCFRLIVGVFSVGGVTTIFIRIITLQCGDSKITFWDKIRIFLSPFLLCNHYIVNLSRYLISTPSPTFVHFSFKCRQTQIQWNLFNVSSYLKSEF